MIGGRDGSAREDGGGGEVTIATATRSRSNRGRGRKIGKGEVFGYGMSHIDKLDFLPAIVVDSLDEVIGNVFLCGKFYGDFGSTRIGKDLRNHFDSFNLTSVRLKIRYLMTEVRSEVFLLSLEGKIEGKKEKKEDYTNKHSQGIFATNPRYPLGELSFSFRDPNQQATTRTSRWMN